MTNSILQSILGAKTLSYNTLFAKALGGNVPAAVFLSQAFFWQEKAKYKSGIDFDSEGYFSKTAAEWHEETGLSPEQQKTARVRLVDAKILLEKRAGLPAKMYFKIDIEALVSGISGYLNTGITVSGFSVNLKPETREAGSGRFRKLEAGNPASNYIDRELKESKESKKESNADANAPLLPPYKKIDEIETETFSFDDEKNPPYPPFPAAPLSPNGAAVRISLTDPDLPGVQIVDEVKPEPQTPPEKTGRGKAKNGRSIEPTIHPENETVFAHFNNPEKARAAWLTWIRYKAAEHRERYKSAETELIKIRSLFRDAAADSETAAQMIEQSIGNLWRGIFKIKDQKNGQQIGNLNAAQRQHLNLANYIAQRRIAAMERAANGGSVD